MNENEKQQLIAALNRQLQNITNDVKTPNFDQTIESMKSAFNNSNLKKKRQLEDLLKTIEQIISQESL